MTRSIPNQRLTKAQENNQIAAKVIRGVLTRAFGPKGLDKLAVNQYGDIFLLRAGVDILEKIDYKHPVAKMMLDLAKAQDSSIGDGSLSAVLLATGLVEKAGELMKRGIHPTLIVEGYERCLEKSLSTLSELSFIPNGDTLSFTRNLVRTSLLCKLPHDDANRMTDLVIQAVNILDHEEDRSIRQELSERVSVIAREGDMMKSSLIDGVAFDASVLNPAMPKQIKGARIAIIQSLFGIRELKFKPEIHITEATSLPLFKRSEIGIIKKMISNVISSGANVLFTHKGIDDLAFAPLSASGILTVRRVGLRDIKRIEQSTGAKMVLSPDEGFDRKLGYSESVEEKKIGDRKWIIVQHGEKHRAVTILARGYVQRSADHVEDTLKRVVRMVGYASRSPQTVSAGGACEMGISMKLRAWASSQPSRHQLAVNVYSEALELLPIALAVNSGMNPMDVILRLRTYHAEGQNGYGIDCSNRKLAKIADKGYVESTSVKRQILSSATEAAISIIRIGDVYHTSRTPSIPKEEDGKDYP